MAYNPGKFVNASLDKASEYNERQCIRITTNEGLEIGVIQIAGLIARRIKCDVSINEMVNTGERYGLIRFGSRVDVYLPSETNVLAAVGQIMVAGETIIADLGSQEEQRFGVSQKEKIKAMTLNVHVLTLTATPIPRTLVMTAYGDMDISKIEEKPKERKDIITLSKPEDKIEEILFFFD